MSCPKYSSVLGYGARRTQQTPGSLVDGCAKWGKSLLGSLPAVATPTAPPTTPLSLAGTPLTCVMDCLLRCIFLATRRMEIPSPGRGYNLYIAGFSRQNSDSRRVCPSESLVGASSQVHTGRPDLGTASADAPLLCPPAQPRGSRNAGMGAVGSESLGPVVECPLARTGSDSCGRAAGCGEGRGSFLWSDSAGCHCSGRCGL